MSRLGDNEQLLVRRVPRCEPLTGNARSGSKFEFGQQDEHGTLQAWHIDPEVDALLLGVYD